MADNNKFLKLLKERLSDWQTTWPYTHYKRYRKIKIHKSYT